MDNYPNMVSRRALIFLYYYAKALGILTCSIDWKTMKVQALSRLGTTIFFLFRMAMLLMYALKLPEVVEEVMETPQLHNRNMGQAQVISLTVFTMCMYIYQTLGDARTTTVVRRFFKLYRSIRKKLGNGSVFGFKFIALLGLKLTATALGVGFDVSRDLRAGTGWTLKVFSCTLVKVFIQMGTAIFLDICFVGFLVIDALCQQMGSHLKCLMNRVASLKPKYDSQYAQMKVLCECSDKLDECGNIFAAIYRTGTAFIKACQLSILFCVYSNFVYLLLQLNEIFWNYRVSQIMPWEKCLACVPNIMNLLLLILCADAAVKKSRIPLMVGIDLACSGIDCRWDQSVESFLNRRNVEHLEVTVLGLFELNNEFALLVLSATITYLFLLIQFDMMWPEHQKLLV